MRILGLALCALLMGASPVRPTDVDAPDTLGGSDTCQAPKTLKGDQAEAFGPACRFFQDLANRDLLPLSRLVGSPFYFEGQPPVSPVRRVQHRWEALLDALDPTPVPLYGMDIYSYPEMVKKYGKPPAKLQAVPLRKAQIAVADLDGRAEVAALERQGGRWVVFAFHD